MGGFVFSSPYMLPHLWRCKVRNSLQDELTPSGHRAAILYAEMGLDGHRLKSFIL